MSLDIITAAYTELLSPKAVSNTRNIASEMGVEDGLEKSRLAFYKNLPLERMLCDVSLLCGEANIAHYYCVDCKCKMSREVSDYLHQTLDNHQHRLTLCSYVDYHGRITPSTTADGFLQGLAGFVGQVSGGIQEVIVKPAQGNLSQFITYLLTHSLIHLFIDVLSQRWIHTRAGRCSSWYLSRGERLNIVTIQWNQVRPQHLLLLTHSYSAHF